MNPIGQITPYSQTKDSTRARIPLLHSRPQLSTEFILLYYYFYGLFSRVSVDVTVTLRWSSHTPCNRIKETINRGVVDYSVHAGGKTSLPLRLVLHKPFNSNSAVSSRSRYLLLYLLLSEFRFVKIYLP